MCTKIDTGIPLRGLRSLEITLYRWWERDDSKKTASSAVVVVPCLGPLLCHCELHKVCVCFHLMSLFIGVAVTQSLETRFGIIFHSHQTGVCVLASHCRGGQWSFDWKMSKRGTNTTVCVWMVAQPGILTLVKSFLVRINPTLVN